MLYRDARLEALVAPGNFVSVRPKSGSDGHWVGAGSGTLPCCALSPLLLLGLAAPSGCSLTSLPSTCTSSLLGAPSSRLFHLEPQTAWRHLWKQLPGELGGEDRPHPAPHPRMCHPSPIHMGDSSPELGGGLGVMDARGTS